MLHVGLKLKDPSDNSNFHIFLYMLKKFAKPELAMQNDAENNLNLPAIEILDGITCVVSRRHFKLLKVSELEGQILELAITARSPKAVTDEL